VIPGHTASIQAVWVEKSGENLLFLGDTCNWAVQFERLAWVPAFDLYPMTSIEGKRRLREEAMRRNALLIFQHDGQVVTGRLVEEARGPVVQVEIAGSGWTEDELMDFV
jgi:glyoxylase-like metal-dependent hydrolase (beta-lactamase superfamily II)